MSGACELHLSAPVARTLESWDWQASDPLLRDAVPTVARGHNLVAGAPPSPAAAAPLIGAVLGRLGRGVRGLMVVPPGMLAEWAGVVFGVAAGTGLRVGAALASAARRFANSAPAPSTCSWPPPRSSRNS